MEATKKREKRREAGTIEKVNDRKHKGGKEGK